MDFQEELARNPRQGDKIRNACGLRKIRHGAKGKGKRGCCRELYAFREEAGEIWMLVIYGKNEMDDIDRETLQTLCKMMEDYEKQKTRHRSRAH